jgi:pimeloyl-ACP methyl ester carboxylesterase
VTWSMRGTLVAGLLISAAGTVGGAQTSTITLAPCRVPGVDEPVRCGALDVPENPERPDGRRLQIGVAVIPAAGTATADPLVPLMGGPGEETIGEAEYFAELFAPLRRDRDILLIDQRGTGRSAPLRCELYSPDDPAVSLRDLFPLPAVERCLAQVHARADVTQYTYAHFANDLEQVRRALGYGPLNLFGGSYGTRAAQHFVRRYPQSVRTAYLGSVVPIDVATPLPMAKAAQQALDQTFVACAADGPCARAFPRLREEFRTVIARLDAGEVRVPVPGAPGTATINRGRVVEWLRSRLYRPGTSTDVPWMIHQAYLGEWGPIAEGLIENARGLDRGVSVGLFFSITCNDDVAFVDEADVVRESRGTFLRDYRIRQQQAACKRWPKVSHPPDYRAPVHSTVPTLFVSGDSDGGTPLWLTDHVAPRFSNRFEVVLRGKGHTDVSECVAGLYAQFVRSGQTVGLDSSACTPTPRPPFKIR